MQLEVAKAAPDFHLESSKSGSSQSLGGRRVVALNFDAAPVAVYGEPFNVIPANSPDKSPSPFALIPKTHGPSPIRLVE